MGETAKVNGVDGVDLVDVVDTEVDVLKLAAIGDARVHSRPPRLLCPLRPLSPFRFFLRNFRNIGRPHP
jgi:hypothetical protein